VDPHRSTQLAPGADSRSPRAPHAIRPASALLVGTYLTQPPTHPPSRSRCRQGEGAHREGAPAHRQVRTSLPATGTARWLPSCEETLDYAQGTPASALCLAGRAVQPTNPPCAASLMCTCRAAVAGCDREGRRYLQLQVAPLLTGTERRSRCTLASSQPLSARGILPLTCLAGSCLHTFLCSCT